MCKGSKIHNKSQKELRKETQNRTRSSGLHTVKELNCVRLKKGASAFSFLFLSCLSCLGCALLSAAGLHHGGESFYFKLRKTRKQLCKIHHSLLFYNILYFIMFDFTNPFSYWQTISKYLSCLLKWHGEGNYHGGPFASLLLMCVCIRAQSLLCIRLLSKWILFFRYCCWSRSSTMPI